jgi:pyridoxine/pyridoxamine 5'-phosphate oxidase
MAISKNDIEDYLKETKSVVLATVDKEGAPQVRHLGAYGVDGADVYLNTAADSEKVAQIKANPKVALLFHKEGQQIPNLKNITVYGEASILSGEEFDKAVDIIKKRRPQAQISRDVNVIIHVIPEKVKVLDFASEDKLITIPASELN